MAPIHQLHECEGFVGFVFLQFFKDCNCTSLLRPKVHIKCTTSYKIAAAAAARAGDRSSEVIHQKLNDGD